MRIAVILFSVLLAACSNPGKYLPTFTPHKIDIRQGNLVTQDMRARIKPGMSEAQVKAALGTPLVNDVYHPERWDYIYRLQRLGRVIEQQRLTLYFEKNILVRIDDATPLQAALPAEPLSSASPPPAAAPVAAPVAAAESVAAAEPVASVAAPVDSVAEVRQRVQDWAAAWSARNVDAYLAAYAPAYRPAGLSRQRWEALRRQRVSKPHALRVELSDIAITLENAHHAVVSFTQDYRADHYRDRVRKTLRMEQLDGLWLIVDEHVDQ
ncbi:hypothetical protein UT4_14450 [Ferrigenium sp. UT4]